ncbi:hypothetical protein BJY59DRAFT_236032 [Rhodotorula toruloides]
MPDHGRGVLGRWSRRHRFETRVVVWDEIEGGWARWFAVCVGVRVECALSSSVCLDLVASARVQQSSLRWAENKGRLDLTRLAFLSRPLASSASLLDLHPHSTRLTLPHPRTSEPRDAVVISHSHALLPAPLFADEMKLSGWIEGFCDICRGTLSSPGTPRTVGSTSLAWLNLLDSSLSSLLHPLTDQAAQHDRFLCTKPDMLYQYTRPPLSIHPFYPLPLLLPPGQTYTHCVPFALT